MSIGEIFINQYVGLVPRFFYPLAFVVAVVFYFLKKEKRAKRFIQLSVYVVLFRIAFALFESAGQYYVWSQNGFTQLFLPPHRPVSYFLLYSGVHYWLSSALAVVCGALFALFLSVLARRNGRYFEEGEVELGVALALIVGWPNFISFLLIVFPSVLLISLFRKIFMGELYTTLGMPFLLSALVLVLWGGRIADSLNLSILAFPRPF